MAQKRDWITRMVDLMQNLKLKVIYNASHIRDFLKTEFDDSISLPTTMELLNSIINAQNNGIRFHIGEKIRILEESRNANNDLRYILVEKDFSNKNV